MEENYTLKCERCKAQVKNRIDKYCRHCKIYFSNKNLRQKRIKEHLCIKCGKKLNKIIILKSKFIYKKDYKNVKKLFEENFEKNVNEYPKICKKCRIKYNNESLKYYIKRKNGNKI